MGYTFGNFQFRNIDKNGNSLLPNSGVLTVLPSSPPTIVGNTAIANRVVLSYVITAFGPDDFTNKQVLVNFSPFQGTGIAGAGLGFRSVGFVDAILTEGVFIGSPSPFVFPLTAKNFTARFQKTGAFTCLVEIEFYMTMDVSAYVGNVNYSNYDRFLKPTPTGIELENGGNSVYNLQKELGIKCEVFDLTIPFSADVVLPTGSTVARVQFQSRWYNSFVLGSVTDTRFMKDIEITTPLQIAAGMLSVTKASATGSQGVWQNVDASFSVLRSQLSSTEKNTVNIRLKGLALPAITPNPATTSIRVLLIRLNPVTNTVDFETDLLLNDAVIPAAQPATGQIDGAIFTPSAWSDTLPDITDLQFDIDGSYLQQNNTYRIIVNVYDNVNNTVTSHISPELLSNFVPAITPTITGELGTYNKMYTGNDLKNIAPHSRFKSRLTIDKASFNAQALALGLTATFDNAFTLVRAGLPLISAVTPQVGFYQKSTVALPLDNSIVTSNFQVVSNTATELIVDCFFRVEEERAGLSQTVDWSVQFNMKTGIANQRLIYEILFSQDVEYKLFENDEISPVLLSAKFYDNDDYPAIKTQVFDVCGRDYIICEVEKDPLFVGSINFVATIYPSDELGNTTNSAIEEEESWLPSVQILPQLSSGKLDNVESGFFGDDFVSFRINLQQLPLNQRFWITGIAYKQIPNYCPIGLVALSTTSTNRTLTAFPAWRVISNPTAVINEILAHPDYVGGLNVVRNTIVDSLGNDVGLVRVYTGYQLVAAQIDQTNSSVFFELAVDAIFDTGSGPHTIRHTLRMEVPKPPANVPPVLGLDNSYLCTDLG